jgi:Xaa-Pro aminopeptidase
MKKAILLAAVVFAFSTAIAWSQTSIDPSEFQARRRSLMEKAPDGIVLLHSFSARKRWDEAGFHQDPNFSYFTGMKNLHGAILAVDGTVKQSWLFVATPAQNVREQMSDLKGADSVYLEAGRETVSDLRIDHVMSWDDFVGFIEWRLKADPKLVLYLDDGGDGSGAARNSNPAGLLPLENPYLLWSTAIKEKWPDANIGKATPLTNEIRAVKSAGELVAMKKAAEYSVAGLWSGAAVIKPGRTQRQIEAAAIQGGMLAGADGVSMWPMVQTGSGFPFVEKFYDYHSGNRVMRAGETITIDVGFDSGSYKGDLGRTFPVSGRFSNEQREILNLLNGAYQAGLRAIRDGTTSEDLIRTCTQYVQEHQQNLKTELEKQAVQKLLDPSTYIMYTHGSEMVEIFTPKVLHTGNTLAFAPEFHIGDQRFYIEDVVLITKDGYELINPPLPYSPNDLEAAIIRERRR